MTLHWSRQYPGTHWIAVVLVLLAGTPRSRAEDAAGASPRERSKDVVVNGDSGTNDTMPSMAVLSDGSTWIAWHAYRDGRDRVLARRLDAGGLGDIRQISGAGRIHDAPLLVAGENETAWIFWETLRDAGACVSGGVSAAGNDSSDGGNSGGRRGPEGRWQLMGRQLKQGQWQTEIVLSDEQSDAMMPAACALGDGRLLLAWSACREGRFQIRYRLLDGESWSEPAAVSSPEHDCFRPAAAACEDGRAWVFWDGYRQGNYAVRGRAVLPEPGPIEQVSPPAAYAITPTALCTRQGMCVAWLQLEDVIGGAGVISQMHTLRMAFRRQEGWQLARDEAGSPVGATLTHGIMVKIEPEPERKLGYMGRCRVPMLIEAADAVWLLWDRKRDPPGHPQLADGELVGRPFRGGQWREPVVLHQGLVDYHVATNPSVHRGKFFILASELPRYQRRVYHRLVVDFKQHQPFAQQKWRGWRPVKLPLPREHASRHEIRLGKKSYKLFWADLHNHSAYTCDAEGEVDELLRYARDRSQIDAVAITDNDDLFDDPLTETEYAKTVFHARQMSRPGKFIVFPGYEWTAHFFRPKTGIPRSDPRIYDYPTRRKLGHGNDHRTVIYPLSGGPLVRHSEVGNDIGALHRAVEPVGGLALVQHSHWIPTGHPCEAAVEATSAWSIYIQRAEQHYHQVLGEYHYGLMGNSDCHRRHPGLAGALSGVYAEELTDRAVLDAIRQRRVFATNGSRIIVDSRANGHFMGRQFVSEDGNVEIVLDVIGTRPLVEITLIRDGETLKTFYGNGEEELRISFKDEKLPPGKHWYYWRIVQEGRSPPYAGNAKVARGQLAWSSPHWVTVPEGNHVHE